MVLTEIEHRQGKRDVVLLDLCNGVGVGPAESRPVFRDEDGWYVFTESDPWWWCVATEGVSSVRRGVVGGPQRVYATIVWYRGVGHKVCHPSSKYLYLVRTFMSIEVFTESVEVPTLWALPNNAV